MSNTMTSVNAASGRRVGISFNTASCQATIFLTQEEFLYFMGQMFDYRDAHQDELQEVVRNLNSGRK